MYKSLSTLLFLLVLVSCSKKESDKNFVLTGYVKGLKNGTLYIQRIKDTALVAIDTIKISGDSHFTSTFDLKSPEMLYLFLDRGVSNSLDNNISFFAEPGKMNIETSLDFFTSDAKITGSKNQELYEEYKKGMSRYTDQNLKLIEERFIAYKNKNIEKLSKIDATQKNIIKRKYLYSINYAVNHGDYEVAPYITIANIYDANLEYLDTIQKSMSPKVSKSLYGKKLNDYITARKKRENSLLLS